MNIKKETMFSTHRRAISSQLLPNGSGSCFKQSVKRSAKGGNRYFEAPDQHGLAVHPKLVHILIFLCFLSGIPAVTQVTTGLPLSPGEAVATCFSGSNTSRDSLVILDIRNPAALAPGPDTNWPINSYHHPDWVRPNGKFTSEIFGITLDGNLPPNIYVTSTTCYNTPSNGGGDGNVYKVDGNTGNVSVFHTLPNAGSGLGNISYDTRRNQFFITNFHDGFIYRIDASGNLLGTFDPGPAFDPSLSVNDFVPLGDRPWGIAVYGDRVYFSMWSEDGRGLSTIKNGIYSVALDPISGNFIGNDICEIYPVPPIPSTPPRPARPVADIAFSIDGTMILAERTMEEDERAYAHWSRVLEYSGGSQNWVLSGNQYHVGSGNNASGGIAYSCSDLGFPSVVATGDALHYGNNDRLYGLQIFPNTGGSTVNSYLIDLDQETRFNDKTQIGDVEVYNDCVTSCLDFVTNELTCTTDGSGDFIWKFSIRNLAAFDAHHLFLLDLPPGVTASPSYFDLSTHALGSIPNNVTSGILEVRLQCEDPSQPVPIRFAMHNEDLSECCFAEVELEKPDCSCAQILSKKWLIRRPGYNYAIQLQNLSTTPVSYVLAVPITPGITLSQNQGAIGPLVYGDTHQFNLGIGGPAAVGGAEVCFRISTHDAEFKKCCSIVCCITLPRIFDNPLDDFDITVFGDVFFNQGEFGLLVEGFGDDGEGGISFRPQEEVNGIDLAWAELGSDLADGAYLNFKTNGTVAGQERELGELWVTDNGADLVIDADYAAVGSDTQRLRFYREGRLIHEVAGYVGPIGGVCSWPDGCNKRKVILDDYRTACYAPTWPHLERFQLVDGNIIEADSVQILAENPEVPVDSVSSFTLGAAGVPAILIRSAKLSLDCNGNGIPDDEEIARGQVGDANRNGVSDDCENLVSGHAFNLNTGFEQAEGVSLEPGSEDDDWIVINPGLEGPARLVIDPVSAWPDPLENSQWISVNAANGESIADVVELTFEYDFCLSSATSFALLDLTLYADDVASVHLNGQPLTGAIGSFDAGFPAVVTYAGLLEESVFLHGKNVLRVVVEDSGGLVTGLDLVGTLRTDGPSCDDANGVPITP